MRIFLYLLLAATGAFGPILAFAQAGESATRDTPEQQWVIVLNDPRPARLQGWNRSQYSGNGHYGSDLEFKRVARRIAKKHDLDIDAEWFIESLGVYCLIAKINGPQAKTLDALKAEKKVVSVQASNSFKLLASSQNHDIGAALFNPPELRLPQSISGQGVIVALIDSAVDQSHPDISDQEVENIDFLSDKTTASNGEPHGTAIAGVIIADQESNLGVTGVAPGARLKTYRSCWESINGKSVANGATNCNTLSMARALDAVATSGKVEILNLSLSGPKDEILDQLVQRIVSQGTKVVAAFDPDRSSDDRFPSPYPGVVTVKAETKDDTANQAFSAPGQKVVASPRNRASFMQGHSVAAAYTSGVLALCLQVEKELQKEICTSELFDRLKSNKGNNLSQLVDELASELE